MLLEITGLIDGINKSNDNPNEYQYVVTPDHVTEDEIAYICPHYVHCNAGCKHMAAVEPETDDGTHEAFPSERRRRRCRT
ncbi:hypothetical protein [Haladaptatus caseinilyticus]|uniref:hypothetical protein n=1 Tax=Haladaptatus caseinilyticus TaxID=2993314 RepID=UPI00224AF4C7|nr:hypothetical protein [Haladaptatus caseinilyticus]